MKFINKIFNIFKDPEEPKWFDWAIYALLAFFLFSCFMYWDLLAATSNATNYLNAIVEGKLMDLYKVNEFFTLYGVETETVYDLPLYIILMLWNLPLALIQRFLNVEFISNFYCLIYMKSLLIIFLFLCCVVLTKICREIGIKKNHIKWAIFIFVSSPIVFASIFLQCQLDIIPIFFVLLGILAYIKEENTKFMLWFAIAIPMKLFPLLMFIPLLLLKEKRVLHIILKTILATSFLIIVRLIEFNMPGYSASTAEFNERMTSKLLNAGTIGINRGYASLFITAYVILCVFCYIKNLKNKQDLYKYSIYIPYSVYMILFAFMHFNPYWLVYVTPFFPLLLFMNSKYFKVNLLVEMGYNLTYLLVTSYYSTFCWDARLVNDMLLSKIFGAHPEYPTNYITVASAYDKWGLSSYANAFVGAYLAAVICLLVLNAPGLNKDKGTIKIERSTILIRMMLIIPLVIVILYCYFCIR